MSGDKRGKGRPKITLEDLPKDWEKKILREAKQGASIVELAVILDISRDTYYRLSEDHEYFFDIVKKCKELSEVWWLRQGRKQLENKDFSYTGWYMNMKNRFGWADKQETKQETSGKIEIKVDKESDFNIDQFLDD